VWYDTNNNGLQDSGEEGVQGVRATLYLDSDDERVTDLVTDASGAYLFCNLFAEDYYIVFSDLPDDYTFTSSVTSDENTNSDAAESNGRTKTYSLAAGETLLEVDGGIVAGTSTSLEDTGSTPITTVVTGTSIALLALYALRIRSYQIYSLLHR